jgi:hypothetical protein
MDSQKHIEPHKITKPIQLLAAWLTGLVLLDGSFLVGATQISAPPWAAGALVVASIVNVPLFVFAMFLLQTKFRPEMQEDSFYSRYLESKTGNTEMEVTAESVASVREDVARLEKLVAQTVNSAFVEEAITKAQWSSVTVSVNKNLDNFSAIAKALSRNKISIHETFGGGGGVPEVFSVALGRGFDVGQVRSLVDALAPAGDGWISFAHDDEAINQYDGKVSIGAYGEHKHGLLFSKLQPLLTQGMT